MMATQEQEVPYLSPEDYVRLRESMQTGWKVAGLSEGVWPPGTPLEFQRLTARTTPRERLEGIRSGQWPFEWREMLNRTPEEVADMREREYSESIGGPTPITTVAKAILNAEEFAMEPTEVLEVSKLLHPSIFR